MDLTTLYRAVIMDHYKSPRNKGLVKASPFHFVHLNNPSCGDDMNVEILIKDGKMWQTHHVITGLLIVSLAPCQLLEGRTHVWIIHCLAQSRCPQHS